MVKKLFIERVDYRNNPKGDSSIVGMNYRSGILNVFSKEKEAEEYLKSHLANKDLEMWTQHTGNWGGKYYKGYCPITSLREGGEGGKIQGVTYLIRECIINY